MTSCAGVTPTVDECLEELTEALTEYGLEVEMQRGYVLHVKNPAGDPSPDDPVAAAMNPGLQQEVTCRSDNLGRLCWWWVWSGLTRDAPPTLELLCAAENVELAAYRIANVVALRKDDAEAEA